MAGRPQDQPDALPGVRHHPAAGRDLAEKGQQQLVYPVSVPRCTGSGNAAGQGVFQRYKLSRRDGLHWSFARCAQMPDAESLARWEKLRTAQLERMRAKAEKQAAEK